MIHQLADRARWAGKRLHDAALRARKVLLGLGGIGSLNAAVWINSVTWGLVATGVSLVLLQFLTEDTP